MSILDVTARQLPSFTQWLENRTPGTQGEDFAAFADLALRTQDQPLSHLSPEAASFGRMWMGACIAAVELCNMEALKHGRTPDQIVATLPRVFAAATMYALASICDADSPFRDLAKIVTEEFRAAAKTTADALTAQNEAETGQ